MTRIIRAKHDAQHAFTQITNPVVRDPSLKGYAFKILLLMLSCSDKFNFNVTFLAKQAGCSKNTAAAAVNKLIDKGHIKRVQKRDKSGRFQAYDYQVFESPCPKNCDPKNCDYKNNKSSSSKKIRKTTEQPPVVVPSSHEDKEIVALYEARMQELDPTPTKSSSPPGYFPALDAVPELNFEQKVQLSKEIKHPDEIPLRIQAYKQYASKTSIASPVATLRTALGLTGKSPWQPNLGKPKSVRDQITSTTKSGQVFGGWACYHDHAGIYFEPIKAGQGCGQGFGWNWKDLKSLEEVRHELRRRGI